MYYALILFAILLDQLIKYLIVHNMELNSSIPVIDPIFYLTYVQNFGAAFSILQNQKTVFIVITSVVAVSLLLVIIKNKAKYHKALLISFSMIIGGGVGNLIDRIRYGYVVDFFDFKIWPVFNIADMFVVCGTFLLAFYVFMIEPKLSKEKK